LANPNVKDQDQTIRGRSNGRSLAIDEVFLGASWQRCRVHFLRNLLSLVPKDGQGMVLAAVRLVFQQPDKARAREELRGLADGFKEGLPRVSALLLEAEEEILAHVDFPPSTGSRSPPPTFQSA
jgi:putative transposase